MLCIVKITTRIIVLLVCISSYASITIILFSSTPDSHSHSHFHFHSLPCPPTKVCSHNTSPYISNADDHNIQSRPSTNSSSNTNNNRQHQTLASIIDSFLSSQSSPQSERDTFTQALGSLGSQDVSELAQQLFAQLSEHPEEFSAEKGVSQEFLDSLERVPVKSLEDKQAECPICTNRFVDDKHPLVVRLPCQRLQSKGHIFDLECVGPWLRMHSTCPLCRFDVNEATKRRKAALEEELSKAREEDDEEEEEGWDVYG